MASSLEIKSKLYAEIILVIENAISVGDVLKSSFSSLFS